MNRRDRKDRILKNRSINIYEDQEEWFQENMKYNMSGTIRVLIDDFIEKCEKREAKQ